MDLRRQHEAAGAATPARSAISASRAARSRKRQGGMGRGQCGSGRSGPSQLAKASAAAARTQSVAGQVESARSGRRRQERRSGQGRRLRTSRKMMVPRPNKLRPKTLVSIEGNGERVLNHVEYRGDGSRRSGAAARSRVHWSTGIRPPGQRPDSRRGARLCDDDLQRA